MGNLTTNGATQSMAHAVDGDRFVSLHSGDPGVTGAANELSTANGYGRQIMATTLTAGTADNDTDLVFGPATADYPQVTHYAVWDAATNGSSWFYGPLSQAKDFDNGESIRIPAADFDLSFS